MSSNEGKASTISKNITSNDHTPPSKESQDPPASWNSKNESIVKITATKDLHNIVQDKEFQNTRSTDVIEICSNNSLLSSLELILHPTELRSLRILGIKQKIQRLHSNHPNVSTQRLIYQDQYLQDDDLLHDILTKSPSMNLNQVRIKIHLDIKEDSSPICTMNHIQQERDIPTMTLEMQREFVSRLVNNHCPELGQLFVFGNLTFRYHVDEQTCQAFLVPFKQDTDLRIFDSFKRFGSFSMSVIRRIDPTEFISFTVRAMLLFLLFGQQLNVDAYILLTSILFGILLVHHGSFRLERIRDIDSNQHGAIMFFFRASSILKALMLSIFPSTEEGLDE